jgi:hypothetical protein
MKRLTRNANVHGIDAIRYKRIIANGIAGSRELPVAIRRININVCDRACVFGRIYETKVKGPYVDFGQQCRSKTRELLRAWSVILQVSCKDGGAETRDRCVEECVLAVGSHC